MSKLPARNPARKAAPKNAAASGDELLCAFNEVRTQLVSTLYFLLGNQDDAQDATQETFLKCWRSREDFAKVRDMRSWIFRVGLNAAKDLQRNAWRRRARPLNSKAPLLPSQSLSPIKALEEREAQERLRSALLNLRQDEKEVFLLRQNGCLTYEEIAKLRCSPVGTVKTQMRAALSKLRQVLHGE
jgi:RNA polymerase sigma-70 factor, ECF subfamily